MESFKPNDIVCMRNSTDKLMTVISQKGTLVRCMVVEGNSAVEVDARDLVLVSKRKPILPIRPIFG